MSDVRLKPIFTILDYTLGILIAVISLTILTKKGLVASLI